MPSVFVSYRRGDSEGQARSLKLELVRLLGKDSVFMDVDSIALGQDFRHVLHERLESSDLMLALIGPGWLDAKDAAGNRRLESATDLVRQEIAVALKRNISITPVLLQGAQLPPPELLPEDIRELVYRNGFELGHSTWESDVGELVKRLGLDQASAAPARASNGAETNVAVSGASRVFKNSWVLAALVVVAIVATVLVTQRAGDQSSGRGIVASSPRPAESSAGRPEGTVPQLPAGFGTITIPNLKTRAVEVYAQNSSGDNYLAAGYAGSISPPATTLQVPAGTYKLKFDKLFVEHVAVTSARSPEILLGTISLPKLGRIAEVYDQSSKGDNYLAAGYAGSISPSTTTLQVPAGTYKLKFDKLFVEHLVITSARSSEILLGTISLPKLARIAEVYDQSSSGDNYLAPGYGGSISPPTTTLQVPAGTYKLKFDKLFVEHVVITSARSSEILLGTISLPKLARIAEVYDQSSSGDNYLAPGYAGSISPPTTTLQVPAGTYKLKFDKLFVQPIRVESGKTVIAQ